MEGSTAATSTGDSVKKNTDCIYFLASPLTCKKGNECEYRHSEGARVNSRDCWYWFNGSCLNPKCSFRHLPLDEPFGILGPVSISSEPASKLIDTSPIPLVHGPRAHNTNKQIVPCYYFQSGYCSKGDRCPYAHKPQPDISSVLQHTDANSSIQSDNSSKVIANKSNTPRPEVAKQNVNRGNEQYAKSKEIVASSGNLTNGHQTIHNNNSVDFQVSSAYTSQKLPVLGSKRIPLNTPGQTQSLLSQRWLVKCQNGKEAENIHRESSLSPVNHLHREDSNYFENEDDYFKTGVEGGRRSGIASDYDKHQSDHGMIPHLESDRHREMRNHHRHEPWHEHFHQERLRSSIRIFDRPMPKTRMPGHEERSGNKHKLDLRHQLLKQKRSNGLGSVVNFEVDCAHVQGDDSLTDERYQTQHCYQDRQHFSKYCPVSSRLHGRIVLPSKLLPVQRMDLRSQVDREGIRIQRKSPRPISIHERIKKRLTEDPRTNNISGRLSLERDDRDSLEFAPRKRLSELKRSKISDNSKNNRRLKSGTVLGDCKLETSLSFEGPKPLSVLKRKRDISPIKGSSSTDVDRNSKGDIRETSIDATAATLVRQHKLSSVSQNGLGTRSSPESSRVVSEDEGGLITEESENLFNTGQRSAKGDAVESEEGMIVDDLKDLEFEHYGDGSWEDDGGDAEDADYKVEDDENVYQDGEDDDEDDFAKKVGFMLS